jgi:hypothetical protein
LQLFEHELQESGAPLEVSSVEYIFRLTPWLRAYLSLSHNRLWSGEFRAFEILAWHYVWNRLRLATSQTGRHMLVRLHRRP